MSSAPPCPKSATGRQLPKIGADKPSSGSKSAKAPKKPKSLPLLVAIKPLNIEKEKKAFFDSGGQYNPQFIYSAEVDPKSLVQYGEPSNRYLGQVCGICACLFQILNVFYLCMSQYNFSKTYM